MIKGYGIAHTTLTVGDIEKTHKFYETLFATKLPMDTKRVFSLLSVGIPCWFVQWIKAYSENDRFDESRIGLDHIAFELKSLDELKEIITRLKEMRVKTKGLQRFAGKYPYVCFRDPDNIQTEFFIPRQL